MSRIISAALCALCAVAISAADVSAAPNAAAGKATFEATCAACHKTGVAGAPKVGDKAAWAPRIKQGLDVLIGHATNGFTGKSGVMPPKGGKADLNKTVVSNAVAYMVEQSK